MTLKGALKAVLSPSARRWLRTQQLRVERSWRRLRRRGNVGSLRRSVPVSTDWGGERGQIVDRYFIEKFLTEHQSDVRGHVLEFADDSYALRFGGPNATRVDVLNLTPSDPRTTIVADLACGEQIPSDTFDCIICTQVLQYVYDLHAGIRTLYRILKPGGVVLVTAPGIQKIDRQGMEEWGDLWRFTSLSLRRLFEEAFPKDQVNIKSYGNVLVAMALLYGFAVEDLRREDLDYCDPDYEVPIAVRAVKPLAAP